MATRTVPTAFRMLGSVHSHSPHSVSNLYYENRPFLRPHAAQCVTCCSSLFDDCSVIPSRHLDIARWHCASRSTPTSLRANSSDYKCASKLSKLAIPLRTLRAVRQNHSHLSSADHAGVSNQKRPPRASPRQLSAHKLYQIVKGTLLCSNVYIATRATLFESIHKTWPRSHVVTRRNNSFFRQARRGSGSACGSDPTLESSAEACNSSGPKVGNNRVGNSELQSSCRLHKDHVVVKCSIMSTKPGKTIRNDLPPVSTDNLTSSIMKPRRR